MSTTKQLGRLDAVTAKGEICPGAVLTLIQWPIKWSNTSPTFSGKWLEPLRAGVDMVIQFVQIPPKSPETVRLSELTEAEAVFDQKDGTRWRMTRRQPEDDQPSYSAPAGVQHEVWVVRGKA